jgi:prefoldin subunit 5
MTSESIRARIAELEKESEDIRRAAEEMRAKIDQIKAKLEGRDKKAAPTRPTSNPPNS